MKSQGRLSLLIAVWMIPCLFSQQSRPAVAVVSEMEGQASVVSPWEGRRALKLFEWLDAGSSVRVSRDSRVVLAFSNGSRYELPAGSDATLLEGSVQNNLGTAKTLQPFPPMPRLPAIPTAAQPGPRAGAIRIRGGLQFTQLYPRANSSVLPESTILIFSPIPESSPYHVTLENETGQTVFEIETTDTEVPIPAGIIIPGSRYYWSVATTGNKGPRMQGYGEFFALTPEIIKERASLKQSLETKGDAESLALLGAVDRHLGLLLEARKEFEAALAKSNGNPAILSMIREIESQLTSTTESRLK